MDKERFRGICLEVLPLINGIMEAVKRNGCEGMASITTEGNDYFSFIVHDTGWNMNRVNGGPIKIHYEYSEEIQLQDQRQEKMAYNRESENLVEISLVYASLQAEHEELSDIDSVIWKQMFVRWANEFEAEYPEPGHWEDSDYLECIERFAQYKILEFAGLKE